MKRSPNPILRHGRAMAPAPRPVACGVAVLIALAVAGGVSPFTGPLAMAVAPTTQSTTRPVTVATTADLAKIENERVAVRFDLRRGTYDIVDKRRADAPSVDDAFARVGEWSANAAGRRHSAQSRDVADAIGTGKTLSITSHADGVPTLLLELTLYDGHGFVAIAAGLHNTGASPVRIKEFHPLTGGGLLAGGGDWTDVRSLNAPTATHQSRVSTNPMLTSANAVLLTFRQDGERRSAVLGALRTADFTKWASTLPQGGHDARGAQIVAALPGAKLVSYLDGGRRDSSIPATNPKLRVVGAEPFSWNVAEGDARFGAVLYEPREIGIDAEGLDPNKRYALGWSWWDYDNNARVQSVGVTGTDGTRHTLAEKKPLPAFVGKGERAHEMAAMIPAGAYPDGKLRVWVSKEVPVANAVVGEVWLYEVAADAQVPTDLAAGRPVPAEPAARPGATRVSADLEAFDPIGRLVDAGEPYLPADSFYFDATTADPFEAMERYGRVLALATNANPATYDFPTVCAWYAGVWKWPEAQDHPDKSIHKLNTSAGLVAEMDEIKKTGFLNYSRAAVRLVPDTYQAINPQGWWDDAHWKSQGYYVAPYETSEAFGEAVQARGGLAFTYFQPACIFAGNHTAGGAAFLSKDFRESHTSLLINEDVRRTLDYTKPEVKSYMGRVFANLRGHVSGIMFDYCDDFWVSEATRGGFADPKVSSTAFYRTLFRLADEGIGPDGFIHERNLGRPNNDLTLGHVDLQRLSWDTDKITPDMVSRGGLRWFKNRVVLNYDMDAKELKTAWKVDGYTGTDADGRRMTLTMAYVAASRLLIANSFRDLSKEELHDLTRVFPYHGERQSARPVDAFVTDGWPRVYDFKVDADWHQVTLYNNALPTVEATIDVKLAGEAASGALGLDASKRYAVYDFWNDALVGVFSGNDTLAQTLRPGEARMLSVHAVQPNPQFIATDRHVMQGYVDLVERPRWDVDKNALAGASKVVAGEPYRVMILTHGRSPKFATATGGATATIAVTDATNGLAVLTIESKANVTTPWEVQFE